MEPWARRQLEKTVVMCFARMVLPLACVCMIVSPARSSGGGIDVKNETCTFTGDR